MGKASAAKTKAVPSGPPPLYDEAVSGPSLVVDVGHPTVWANTTTTTTTTTAVADGAARPDSEDAPAVLCRWGHTAELSPSEGVLCVIGGRPCNASRSTTTAAAVLDSLAWTAALSARGSKSARVWQTASCLPAQPGARGTSGDAWPHYAPCWATWEAATHESERPVGACVDGGWAAGRRRAGTVAFVADHHRDEAAPPAALALPLLPGPSRSHHSMTGIRGMRYRFGGETQEGTVAALEVVDSITAAAAAFPDDGAATRTAESTPSPRPGSALAAAAASAVPPPRAAHGACALCQRFLFVLGGRRVDWRGDGGTAAGREAANSPGKAASRAASVKRNGKASSAVAEVRSESGAAGAATVASLAVCADIGVYDTRLQAWLPVRVTGGAAPRGRYASAVAAVPTSGTAATGHHREVLVLGGLDAASQTCDEAWLLQFLSGADGELADAPTSAGALPVVTARWVRLCLPAAAAAIFGRHHAAAVVSSQRIAYVVGGCAGGGGSTTVMAAAQPCVYTLALPHLTATTVHADEVGSADDATVEKVRSGGSGAGTGSATSSTKK